ncbi:extracellular solute-binding protein [Bradyrhizobium sp. LHD-71]|uniref:extracellular solute-binding protein n=1 Tax=Bradyrhizobium sp. LHD-71 TaxID=3072141 RepID=UPI00280E0C8D|nr:extracellular solute-binding protein [Bradyrhizobium sp. LHD-71]MDQ8727997.1 extracellular solute-binding protein [Bradyrhizobium sp. LHD-71]
MQPSSLNKGRTKSALIAAMLTLLSQAAFAQSPSPLVIATYAGESAKLWKRAVADPFTTESGIPTTIFESPLPSSSVASAQGQPQFHAAILGAYQVPNVESQIEELTPEDVPNVKEIPEKYWVRTSSGKLAGVPIYFSYLGIAYNTDLAKPADFTSWKDLAAPKWKDRISISRPVFVAAYDLTLYAKLEGGDENNVKPGIDLLSRIAGNALNVYTSMASVQAQLGRGEVVATPFYSTQIAMLRRAGVTNVDILTPKEGGLLLTYVLAIPKGAKNLEGAKRLLNAAIKPDYQLRLAEGGIWPMNPNAKLTPELEKSLGGTLENAMARNYAPNWYTVGKANPERTRLVEDIIEKSR